jgi:hypothetical protein
LSAHRRGAVISPALFVLVREQIKRGDSTTSLCALLAEASEIAFTPPGGGNPSHPFRCARRPT